MRMKIVAALVAASLAAACTTTDPYTGQPKLSNTAGGALGALLGACAILPWLGMSHTVLLAAHGSALIGVLVSQPQALCGILSKFLSLWHRPFLSQEQSGSAHPPRLLFKPTESTNTSSFKKARHRSSATEPPFISNAGGIRRR